MLPRENCRLRLAGAGWRHEESATTIFLLRGIQAVIQRLCFALETFAADHLPARRFNGAGRRAFRSSEPVINP